MKPSILIAEDDKNILLLLTDHLGESYDIVTTENGFDAWNYYKNNKVDLIVTDIAMPVLDGYQLLERIREENKTIPILMLTANHSFNSKKVSFSTGVDDYLTKPFELEELEWRIKALLRRVEVDSGQIIHAGSVSLDKSTYNIFDEKNSIQLPKKEFDLLFKLLSQPGQIFTKHQIMEDIWGYDSFSSEDTIKTHISRLRSKIKQFSQLKISAIKGIGYKAEVE